MTAALCSIALAVGLALGLMFAVWSQGRRSHEVGQALDPRPVAEAVEMTPRQLAYRLRSCTDAELVDWSRRMIDNRDRAMTCLLRNHGAEIHELNVALWAWRERAIWAEAKGMHQALDVSVEEAAAAIRDLAAARS